MCFRFNYERWLHVDLESEVSIIGVSPHRLCLLTFATSFRLLVSLRSQSRKILQMCQGHKGFPLPIN